MKVTDWLLLRDPGENLPVSSGHCSLHPQRGGTTPAPAMLLSALPLIRFKTICDGSGSLHNLCSSSTPQSLQFNQELLSYISMPCAEGQAQHPLPGVSLATTYENLPSSLHRAAALVSTPMGETEAVNHHCQSALCEKRASALYSCPFPLSPSCPARLQRCSLLLCPVSIIRTQQDSCIPVAS